MQLVRIASPVVGAVSNCASRGVVSSVRLEIAPTDLYRVGIYYRTPYATCVRIASPVVGAVSNCASRGFRCVLGAVRGISIALPIRSFDPRSLDRTYR